MTPAIHHCIHGGEATLTFGHFHFIFGGPGYSPAQCHPMRSVWRALLGPHAPDHRMLIGTMCWIDHRCASGHFPGIFPFFPFPFRRFPLPFPKGYSLPMPPVYHAWCGESGKRGGSSILPRGAHELDPTPEMGVSGVVSRRICARIQFKSKTFFYKKTFGKSLNQISI